MRSHPKYCVTAFFFPFNDIPLVSFRSVLINRHSCHMCLQMVCTVHTIGLLARLLFHSSPLRRLSLPLISLTSYFNYSRVWLVCPCYYELQQTILIHILYTCKRISVRYIHFLWNRISKFPPKSKSPTDLCYEIRI